jgi:hypothetical protein
VLAEAGITADDIRADIRSVVGEGILGPGAAAALHFIGIDLDAVRARVEEAFGPGALERANLRAKSRWRHRRRCDDSEHIPFTPRTKKVLELALRKALRLRHGYVGTEHILLGLLTEGEGLAVELLSNRGIRLDDLRRRVLAAIGKVA